MHEARNGRSEEVRRRLYKEIENGIVQSNVAMMEMEWALSRENRQLELLEENVRGDENQLCREANSNRKYDYNIEDHPKCVTDEVKRNLDAIHMEHEEWRVDCTKHKHLVKRFPQLIRKDLFPKQEEPKNKTVTGDKSEVTLDEATGELITVYSRPEWDQPRDDLTVDGPSQSETTSTHSTDISNTPFRIIKYRLLS